MELRYQESAEEAAQVARQALPFASKHNLPANPVNYAVFYEYIIGSNTPFCLELEHILKEQNLTQAQIEDLYQRYIVQENEESNLQAQEQLRNIMLNALSSIIDLDSDSTQYQKKLRESMINLEQDHDFSETRAFVAQIIKDTHMMASSTAQLQQNLNQANLEITELRQKFERTRHEALTDPLTGLSNRRGFDAALLEIRKESEVNKQNMALVIIDIDHFKAVNDKFGHTTGDEVLRYVAATLREVVRGNDITTRYGGEEFAIILPETDLEGAHTVANNIRKRICRAPIGRKASQEIIGTITISAGVGQLKHQEEISTLIERTDAALYDAKNQGRNRVCFAK